MKASRGEIKICDILDEAGLPYQEEYIFPDLISSSGRPLRFDFCVFNDDGGIDFLIEYQGVQHFEPRNAFGGKKVFYQQKHNDKLKRLYCLRKGYPLILIPYWDLSRVDYDYIMKAANNW